MSSRHLCPGIWAQGPIRPREKLVLAGQAALMRSGFVPGSGQGPAPPPGHPFLVRHTPGAFAGVIFSGTPPRPVTLSHSWLFLRGICHSFSFLIFLPQPVHEGLGVSFPCCCLKAEGLSHGGN